MVRQKCEHRLRQVIGVMIIAGDASARFVHHRSVPSHQFGERVLAMFLGVCVNQFPVRFDHFMHRLDLPK
jgi:hypothetical protein